MMQRYLVCGLLLLGLVACMSQPPGPGRTSRPATPAIFATQLAGPGTFLPPMPTAVVILKPNDMARNRAFCAAFQQLPTAQEAMASTVVAPNLILTRWLTQLSDVPADRARDCEYLTGTYDYARAASLMASVHPEVGTFSGQGPFLVMVIPDPRGFRFAGVDGSTYSSTQFDQFIASWNNAVNTVQSRIGSAPDSPGVVRSLLNLVAAVLRTVFGAAAGLIQGAVSQI